MFKPIRRRPDSTHPEMRLMAGSRSTSLDVMPGLDPGIHLQKISKTDGLPGHKGVYARLRRAIPGNDN
jgi:hypothetical protein